MKTFANSLGIRRAVVAVACAAMALPLASCQLRLDTGSDAPAAFSVDSVARQRAAWCATQASGKLSSLSKDNAKEKSTIDRVVKHQEERHRAFGEPWPDWTGIKDAPKRPQMPKVPTTLDGVADILGWCSLVQKLDSRRVESPDLQALLFSSSIGTYFDAQALSPTFMERAGSWPKADPSQPLVRDSETNTYVVDAHAAKLIEHRLKEAAAKTASDKPLLQGGAKNEKDGKGGKNSADSNAKPSQPSDDANGGASRASDKTDKGGKSGKAPTAADLVRDMDAARYNLGLAGASLVMERQIDKGASLIVIIDRIEGEVDLVARAVPSAQRQPAYPKMAPAKGLSGTNGVIAAAFDQVISARVGLIGKKDVPIANDDTWNLIKDCERYRSSFASNDTPALPGLTLVKDATAKKK